eukprot:Platyproteum_vivax@DN16612_c0_g1_i1.p1
MLCLQVYSFKSGFRWRNESTSAPSSKMSCNRFCSFRVHPGCPKSPASTAPARCTASPFFLSAGFCRLFLKYSAWLISSSAGATFKSPTQMSGLGASFEFTTASVYVRTNCFKLASHSLLLANESGAQPLFGAYVASKLNTSNA